MKSHAIRSATLLAPLLAILACPAGDEPLPEDCGDGAVEDFEECDDGEANSDTSADACRTDCTLPACGDGVTDGGETCDDGATWGGDGCTPSCQAEQGRGEVEPNDTSDQAEVLASGEPITGALPTDDVDCFAVEVTDDGWLAADVEGELSGSCPDDLVIRLFDPAGAMLEVATPVDDGGCSPIDPLAAPAARFMAEGSWTLCLEGHQEQPVRTYALTVELGADSCSLDFPHTSEDDPDGDGEVNVCDVDDDGDGVADSDDDCPLLPDGGEPVPLAVDGDGFVRDWLFAGPFTGHETTEECRASEDEILGDDAAAIPELGTLAGEGLSWFAFFGPGSRVDFLDVMAGPTAREVYAATWIHSPVARAALLAIGPDDGARVWFEGEEILDIVPCQGTTVDKYTHEVELAEGWSQVLVKVRDQGGAWAMYFRFLDPETEEPLTDLGVSLSPYAEWTPGQSDLDGDGQGDICDITPAG